MRGRATLAAIVLCGGVAAGCGSSSSDQHDASVASQAVQQALAQQRQHQEDAAQKANLRKQQRKHAHEKGQDAQKAASAAAGGSGGSGSQQGGGAAGNGGGGPHDCGSGVTANNAGTTCSFALNVAEQYRASGGASTIEVYSPVTKQTYTMSCVGASATTCTGGNNASVTFS